MIPDQTDDARVSAAKTSYTSVWQKVITEWKSSEPGNYVWLIYSANYLFRTAGVRWALDPLAMSSRIPGMKSPAYLNDLDKLQLVVLSHNHQDHFDKELVIALQAQKVMWVIPEFMLEAVKMIADIPSERIYQSRANIPIRFGNLTLTPFEGLHLRDGNGVEEMGYLVEFPGQRWLFPGDTRLFDTKRLPQFGQLDGVFAHIWLGKGRALETPPPLIGEFLEFFCSFSTRRLVITHLNEYGRDETERWDESHYRYLSDGFMNKAPGIKLDLAVMGDKIEMGSSY